MGKESLFYYALVVFVFATAAPAQDGSLAKVDQGGDTAGANMSATSAVMEHAATANKYVFAMFYRTMDVQTKTMREALDTTMKGLTDRAVSVMVRTGDPLEKETVKRFEVARAPMPLILAIAPNGAVTRSFLKNFPGDQAEQALVSVGESDCLKCLQERKLVVLCVQGDTTKHNDAAMKGVIAFKDDERYAATASVVMIDPSEPKEAAFLKKLEVDPKTEEAVTVLMTPPGRPIGSFNGATSKAALVAAVRQAGAGCKPGSGCCPPKKNTKKKS